MLKNEMLDYHPSGDPLPRFATDAEVEFAQRLRHRLEERYLGHSEASAATRGPREVH